MFALLLCYNYCPAEIKLDDFVIPEETVRRSQVAQLLSKKINQLGPMSYNEKMVGALFWILVLLWFFRFVKNIKVVPRAWLN